MERKEIRRFLENHLHKPSEGMVNCVKIILDTQVLAILDEIGQWSIKPDKKLYHSHNVEEYFEPGFTMIRNRINQGKEEV